MIKTGPAMQPKVLATFSLVVVTDFQTIFSGMAFCGISCPRVHLQHSESRYRCKIFYVSELVSRMTIWIRFYIFKKNVSNPVSLLLYKTLQNYKTCYLAGFGFLIFFPGGYCVEAVAFNRFNWRSGAVISYIYSHTIKLFLCTMCSWTHKKAPIYLKAKNINKDFKKV